MFSVIDEDISSIEKIAQNYKKHKNILLFGTGGSSLGAKTLVNFKAKHDGIHSKIHFIENIDSLSFLNKVNLCNQDNTGIIVISKSGMTTETIMLFLTLFQMWPDFNYKNNAVIVTENTTKANILRTIATEKNIKVIDHPSDIGGRFSVFSVVGMLPALIAGVDISSFLKGAKEALSINISIGDISDAIRSGANHHVIFSYSDFLSDLGKWVVQLISESLGKRDDFGITPLSATGTIDQHSMLQLFLGGPNNKFYTFITQKKNAESERIRVANYLDQHNINELMQCHQKATIEIVRKKAYVREFSFDQIDEKALGFLMATFMIETIAIANEFNINPFDQPAVEESKKLVEKYLNEYHTDR
jgi:glucose-6-phosphate isomerase